MSYSNAHSRVIVQSGNFFNVLSLFTNKAPLAFTGPESYRLYQNDVGLWSSLTNLACEKREPALLGRLSREAKIASLSLPLTKTFGPTGLEGVLAQPDRSYAFY